MVTVDNDAVIAPGASAGTLTLGGLDLNANSWLHYELDTPDIVGGGVNDLLQVNGALNLDGVLSISNLSNFGAGTYRLINYTGSLTDNGLLFGTVPGGYDLEVSTSTANQVNLIVTATNLRYWDGSNTSQTAQSTAAAALGQP